MQFTAQATPFPETKQRQSLVIEKFTFA